MSKPLIMSLLECCGYLEDEGWRQTAQLMKIAAQEIETLNERIAELESRLKALDDATGTLPTPDASNQNVMQKTAARSSRR